MKAYATLRHMSIVAGGDLERVSDQGFDLPLGHPSWMVNEGGLAIYTAIQNRTLAAYTQGQLVASVGDAEGKTTITDILSGSREHAVTTGLTADLHVGALAFVVDYNAVAGGGPEGQSVPVQRNTTTRLDFKEPLTEAVAVNDDLLLVGTYNTELAAIADVNTAVMGVVVPENGIPVGGCGYTQQFGLNRRVLGKAATAIAANAGVIADAGRVNVWAATAPANTVIGKCIGGIQADSVSDMGLVRLSCGNLPLMGFGTIDANIT